MKRYLFFLLFLSLPILLEAQETGNLRPRWGTTAAGAQVLSIVISVPTLAPTYELSVAAGFAFSGSAADDVLVTAVTWECTTGTCTPDSGSATGTTAWSVSGVTVPCAVSPGSTSVITVTASDGTSTVTDTLTVHCQTPDTSPPTVTIDTPTTSPTYSTSTQVITLGGTADDDTAVVSATLTCAPSCGSNVCSVQASGNFFTFTCPAVTQTAGSNTLTVTAQDTAGNMGTDVLTSTYTTPDTTAPVVTVVSPSSSPFATAVSPVPFSGTASDAVGVTQVTWTSDVCGSGTAAGTTSWSFTVSPSSGVDCVVTVSAQDQAMNVGSASAITVQYLADLVITTTSPLPIGTVSSAYTYCMTASGGKQPYTWTRTGGAFPTGTPAYAISASTGCITGTPTTTVGSPFSPVIQVADNQGTPDTASGTFSMSIQAAGSETAHSFYEFQVNKEDAGGATATSSGRQKCGSFTQSDCIVQITECPDTTYAENGACSFRSQAQLDGLRAGSFAHPIWGRFLYPPSDSGVLDMAQVKIAGITTARIANNDNIGCNKLDTAADGIDSDNGGGGGFGSSVTPGSTFDSDQSDDYAGCSGIATGDQLFLTWPIPDPASTVARTLTFVWDDYWPVTWLASAPPTPPEAYIASFSGVANCGAQGGLAGDRPRLKTYRIDSTTGHYLAIGKHNYEQAQNNTYFKTSSGDAGWWDCDKKVMSVFYVGSQMTAKQGDVLACPSCAVGAEISPSEIGTGTINNDPSFNPGSGDATNYLNKKEDWPIRADKKNRYIAHLQLRVPADSTVFDAWRAGCDPSGTALEILTSSVANPTVVTTRVAHGLTTGNTVVIQFHTGSTPEINGVYTATVTGTTTFTIPVNVTTAGTWGAVVKRTTSSVDTTCAAMNATITGHGQALATSLWHTVSVGVISEDLGLQWIVKDMPFHAADHQDGTVIDPRQFRIELNGSRGLCNGCGDTYQMMSDFLIIQNIDAAAISDTGCPAACAGDSASITNNVFRKPKR